MAGRLSVRPSAVAERLRASVLGLPDFRRLWAAQTVSTIGDQVFPIAATIAVLDQGGGATQIGIVLGARVAAIVLFALFGGVWADRLSRRLVMITADVFRAAVLTVLALLPTTPPVPALALLVFLVGAGEAFFRPAEAALLPALVPEPRRNSANGLIMVSFRTAAVIGPGLGGVLVGVVGVRAAFALNAVTFAMSALFLRALHEPARSHLDEPRQSIPREIREGAAEVASRRWVLANMVAASLLLLLVVAPEQVLLPVISRAEFGDDRVYVASLALMSLGGVFGALIAMRWRPRHPGQAAWLLGLVYLLAILALMRPVAAWPILLTFFVSGVAFEPFMVFWNTALQREIPQDKLARVASLDWMSSFALMPIGLAVAGPLADALGQDVVLAGAGVSLLLITFAVLLVPGVRDMRTPGTAADGAPGS
jgi:MFS family permease